MRLNAQCQAILMLTVRFGREAAQIERPLSMAEWAKFARWLQGHKIDPAQLLAEDVETLLHGWTDQKISFSRLERLLGQGMALGLATERWERAGLWILTRYHHEYPARLKTKLGIDAPPVLIGCGNKKLLYQGGIAVVGSRNVHEDGLAYTRELAKAVSEYGKSIISGGARGVDITAMEATLKADGTCVGVLADSLMRSSASTRFRKYLLENSLALVTPFNPEAGFNVGNAMARNRYIYCLSDCAVVVDSTKGKGGTWNGAEENLKRKWVPVFVKPSEDRNSGNAALLEMGAYRATTSVNKLYEKVTETDVARPASEASTKEKLSPEIKDASPSTTLGPNAKSVEIAKDYQTIPTGKPESIFEYALPFIKIELSDKELKMDEVALQLNIEKAQAKAWLERAAKEGHIIKHARSVRFGNGPAPSRPNICDSGKSEEMFNLALPLLKTALADREMKVDEVASTLGLEKTQAKAWLEKAADEGRVAKRIRSVRFGNIPAPNRPDICDSGKSEEMFNLALPLLKTALADREMKADEVASTLELEKTQAKAWLEKAADEGRVAKHSRPIRFGNIRAPSQPSLFDKTNVEANSA